MVQVLSRAAAILRALEAHPGGRPLSDIAADIGVPKSTVHRILQTLEAEELVSQVGGRSYRLGPSLLRLGALTESWVVGQLHPVLRDLSAAIDETVDLSIRSADEVLFIDQVAAPRRLQALSQTGVRFPAHCCANGKALLAELDDQEVRQIMDGHLTRFTETTITTMDGLLEDLREVRRTGVAYDREEHTIGICAVGVAVRSSLGIPAALSIPVPTARFADVEERAAELARDGARRAAAAIGELISASEQE